MQLLQAGLLLSCAVLTVHAADVVCGGGRTRKIVTLKAGESANFYTSAPGTDYKKNVKCKAVFKRARRNQCELNFSCEAFALTAANAQCRGRSDFFTVSTVRRTRFCQAAPDTSTQNGRLTVNFISNRRSQGGPGAVCTATCLAPGATTPAPPATTLAPPATTPAPPATTPAPPATTPAPPVTTSATPPATTAAPTPVTGATAPPTTAGTLPPATPVTTANPLPSVPPGPIEVLTRVRFELFPGSGAPVESVLFDGTTVELPDYSQFDSSKPLKVVIHGWTESSLVGGQVQDNNQMPKGWAEDYHGAGMDFTVLGVHWVPKAGWGDPNSPEAEDAANTVSRLLYSLARDYKLSMDKVHMTGFSMGTVVTSWTAKKVQELGLVPLGRTTLLDPCIAKLATIISKSDATMVDVIHTSALGICSEDPLGHVDFFVNGGRVQVCGSGSCSCPGGGQVCTGCYFGRPRCSSWGWLGAGWHESHMRAVQLYRESITAEQGRGQTFPSWRCSSYPAMQADSEQCPYDVTLPLVAMGEDLLDRGRPEEGVYFLKTNGDAPYSYKSYEN